MCDTRHQNKGRASNGANPTLGMEAWGLKNVAEKDPPRREAACGRHVAAGGFGGTVPALEAT